MPFGSGRRIVLIAAFSCLACSHPPRESAASLASVLAPACGDPGDVLVFVSPAHPLHGQPVRVIAVADHLIDGQLTLSGARGVEPVVSGDRHGGPPYFWIDRVDAPSAGKWTATFARSDACEGAM